MKVCVLFVFLFASLTCYADIHEDIESITFGPEFTLALASGQDFGSANEKNEKFLEYKNALKTHLKNNQPEDAKFQTQKHQSGLKFISPNGWSFVPGTDRGVFEIRMKPMTVAESERFADDIQDAIFATGASVGMFPSLFMGGGHLNIGLQTLGQHPLLLRNFIMDMLNNSFLFNGLFGYDTHNAFPMNMVDDRHIQTILNIFLRYDEMETPRSQWLLEKLYDVTKAMNDSFPRGDQRQKNIAFSFLNAQTFEPVNLRRLEVRGVRPQASYHVYVNQIRLLKNRLHYLSRLEKPLEFNPRLPFVHYRESSSVSDYEIYNPPYSAQASLKAFYIYITETGENWEDHRTYIWPKWFRDYETGKSELAIFEQSDWFKSQEAKKNNCQKYLI